MCKERGEGTGGVQSRGRQETGRRAREECKVSVRPKLITKKLGCGWRNRPPEIDHQVEKEAGVLGGRASRKRERSDAGGADRRDAIQVVGKRSGQWVACKREGRTDHSEARAVMQLWHALKKQPYLPSPVKPAPVRVRGFPTCHSPQGQPMKRYAMKQHAYVPSPTTHSRLEDSSTADQPS